VVANLPLERQDVMMSHHVDVGRGRGSGVNRVILSRFSGSAAFYSFLLFL